MRNRTGSPLERRGILAWVSRRRAAVAILLLVLNASPAMPDDRQLLRLSGSTDILVILDSSSSMTQDFVAHFDLPAYMDDFVYPEGTSATNGSKFGVAKSVLREVITKSEGVNWGFASYRNPNPTFGAAMIGTGFPDADGNPTTTGQAVGGAHLKRRASRERRPRVALRRQQDRPSLAALIRTGTSISASSPVSFPPSCASTTVTRISSRDDSSSLATR